VDRARHTRHFDDLLRLDARRWLGGGSDIFVARRSTRNAPFGAPAAVPELNGALNEAPSWVSADDCTIILTRRSVSLPTERDYFIAERPK
jgi:hypothetical protein